jgi:DNA-binding CsgD family transcriptional regulator
VGTASGVVGREPERARIEHALERALGGPVGLCLEGAPGVGKTTVWREAVRASEERGFRVLVTTPAEPDALLSFAGLGDLFDGGVSEVMAALPDPQRRALTAALLLEEASVPTAPEAVPRAVLTVVRRLAAEGPLVVAIDDEQWLDRASGRVLAFALCRLRDEPVCVVLARRPNSESALWPELGKGFGPTRAEHVAVSPLDLPTTDLLFRTQLGRALPRPLLRRVHAECGGNPFYALAIARELPTDAPAASIPIPRTLAEALRVRLARVDRRGREPLLVVAACSSPTLALLQAVLPGFALADLDTAQRAEVVEITGGNVRFTHPLLASAHLAAVSGARLREVHRALAAVIEDEEERARHLALGAEAPDEQLAKALEQAAGGADRRGAPESAAELLDHAARLTPLESAEARHLRSITAARMHIASGDAARARHLLEELLPELPHGPVRARALVELINASDFDYETYLGRLGEALTEAGDDDGVHVLIESGYSEALVGLGRYREAVDHAGIAVQCAKRARDPRFLAEAVAVKAAATFWTGEAVDLDELEAAVELEDLSPLNTGMLPSFVLGQILSRSDDVPGGRLALERAVQRARRRGEDQDAAQALFHLLVLQWFAGDHEAARRNFAICEQGRGQHELKSEFFLTWAESFFAAGRGDLTQARQKAQEALGMCADHVTPNLAFWPAVTLAQIDVWSGLPQAAHERLGGLRESLLAGGFGAIGFLTLGMWTVDIDALIALDRLDAAEQVFDDLNRRARRAKNPNAQAIAHRYRGLLLGAQGHIPEAIGEMDAALADHARRTLQPELARTLLDKGALQRRAKHKSAAKHTLEAALALLEPLDAAILKARARDELSRIGLRRPAVTTGLTAAQTRVADLAAAGMSNREIANTLFMSTRSVEAHLTKTYRELGIRSRAQLAAALATNVGQAPDGSSPAGAEDINQERPETIRSPSDHSSARE